MLLFPAQRQRLRDGQHLIYCFGYMSFAVNIKVTAMFNTACSATEDHHSQKLQLVPRHQELQLLLTTTLLFSLQRISQAHKLI